MLRRYAATCERAHRSDRTASSSSPAAGLRALAHAILWSKRHLFGELAADEVVAVYRFLTPESVCIDIGAHGGSWTVPLSRLVPHGHVYAVEAFPYYASVLTLTLQILRRRNVTVLNYVVYDQPKSARIVHRESSNVPLTGTIHLAGTTEDAAESMEVPGTTLDILQDAYQLEAVDLLKMDIEGAELLALRGGSRLLRRHRPVVFLELYDTYCSRYGFTVDDVFQFFSQRDFNPYVVFSSSEIVPILAADYPGRGDVLFVPAESRLPRASCE